MLALNDSGAKMVLMGSKHAALLGIKETEYLPAKMIIQVAYNRTIRVLGITILKITTVGTNKITRQQAYILEAGDQLYLIHQALQNLGQGGGGEVLQLPKPSSAPKPTQGDAS